LKFRLLSYPLRPDDAVWPGNPPAVDAQPLSSISKWDFSNKTILQLCSHSGTHLDTPRHSDDSGLSAFELAIENYIFFAPLLVEVPKPNGGAILRDSLEAYENRLQDADLVLLRTGWSDQRYENRHRYASEGPFLHPDAARLLMEYPNLKGVAIDAVSIGAPRYREESLATHRILLGNGRTDGRFLLILEDLRIDPDLADARRIYAWPLMIEGSDGSPITIVAEFGDL
jgi:kynurenine formamidase